jgi:hypothetical protein
MQELFHREKYREIARTQGVAAAVTALQHDTIRLEVEMFEGQAGYRPELQKTLREMRDFSRELWEIPYQDPTAKV